MNKDVSLRRLRWLPVGIVESPWEFLIALVGVLSGLYLISGGDSRGSLNQELPRPLPVIWNWMSFLGCLFIVYGLLRSTTLSRLWERTGLILLAGTSFVYGLILIVLFWGNPLAVLAGTTRWAIAGACLIQIYLSVKGWRLRPPLTREEK